MLFIIIRCCYKNSYQRRSLVVTLQVMLVLFFGLYTGLNFLQQRDAILKQSPPQVFTILLTKS